MLQLFHQWYKRYFSHEESIYLVFYVLAAAGVFFFLGGVLSPLFVAITLAYLMQGGVASLKAYKMPHLVAVFIVYAFFLGGLTACLFVLLPLAWSQLLRFVDEQLPELLKKSQQLSSSLAERYPNYFTESQALTISEAVQDRLAEWGQALLSLSLSGLPNVIGIMIFLVLVPVLVLFFLKDRDVLIQGFVQLLPAKRPITPPRRKIYTIFMI